MVLFRVPPACPAQLASRPDRKRRVVAAARGLASEPGPFCGSGDAPCLEPRVLNSKTGVGKRLLRGELRDLGDDERARLHVVHRAPLNCTVETPCSVAFGVWVVGVGKVGPTKVVVKVHHLDRDVRTDDRKLTVRVYAAKPKDSAHDTLVVQLLCDLGALGSVDLL